MTSLEQQLRQWLSLLKFPVSQKYLQQELLSHPDYPSLLSITDTLDKLGIENAALLIDKNKLEEIPLPFLAHLEPEGGGFILVKNLQALFKRYPDFMQYWDGITVIAEPSNNSVNKENERLLAKEKSNKLLTRCMLTIGFFFTLLALSYNLSTANVLRFLTTITGIWIAILIIQHNLGYNNVVTDQLCGISKHTDCNAVLHSKGSTLGWLDWSDAGIIYFFSLWLLLVQSSISGYAGSSINISAILSSAAIPFTFFSVFYQWQVIKKWCMLCMIVVGILWAQFIVQLPVLLTWDATDVTSRKVIEAIFLLLLVASGWLLLIKPLMRQRKEYKEKAWPLLRFKNNSHTFITILKTQRRVNTGVFTHDLQIGNPDAPIQLVVACGPFCSPCARMHEILEELLTKHADELGLTIRFAVKANETDNKRVQAVSYMLQYIKQHTEYMHRAEKRGIIKTILHDWYTNMNYEDFMQKNIVKVPLDVSNWLEDHETWSSESKIEFTPTLFINGYEFPRAYDVEDLALMLRGLKEEVSPQYDIA